MGEGSVRNPTEARHNGPELNGGSPAIEENNLVDSASKSDGLKETYLTVMLSLCAGLSFAAASLFLTLACSNDGPYDRLAFVGHLALPLIVLPPFMTSAQVDEVGLLVSVGLKREFFIASVFFCLPYMSPTEITVLYHGWLVVFIILVRWIYLRDIKTFPWYRIVVILTALGGIYSLSSTLEVEIDIHEQRSGSESHINGSLHDNTFHNLQFSDDTPGVVYSYIICMLFAFICSVYRTAGQKYSFFLIYFHELIIIIYFGLIAKYIFEPPFSKWRLEPVLETTCLFTGIVFTETIGLWSYFKSLHLRPAVKYTCLVNVELIAIYYIEKHFIPWQYSTSHIFGGVLLVLMSSLLMAGERILTLRRIQNTDEDEDESEYLVQNATDDVIS